MQKYAILRNREGEKDCKGCGRENGHLSTVFPVGDDGVGAIGSICPEGPRAGTDQALCDRCERDVTGRKFMLVKHPDTPGDRPLAMCWPCVECITGGWD